MFGLGAGMAPRFASPPEIDGIVDIETEEAAVAPPAGPSLHVTPLVTEDEIVARGAPIACLRHAPDICLVAPIAGRVARMSLLPGRRLSEIVLFREPDGGVERHDLSQAETEAGLRRLMQASGIWPWLRRRPFGGMPDRAERPAAIVVMAADTRPFAPDPAAALAGQEEALSRGLAALLRLTEGPVLVCRHDAAPAFDQNIGAGRLHVVPCGARHPQAAAGIRIHADYPAGLDTPVWDIHAEDVAAIGTLLQTGELPQGRLVRIAGPALRMARSLRTHPGADLRQLTQNLVKPGPHLLMSGSPLDGQPSKWLAPRHRQVTVAPRASAARRRHWLAAALTQTPGGQPAIPTAALSQAFAAALPAVPFIRALSAGDDETAMNLGLLSLLEEDIALADYVLGKQGDLAAQLRGMLDRIATEFAA